MPGVPAGVAYVDIRGEFAKLGQDIKTGVTKSLGQAESNLAGRFSNFGKNLGRNLLAGVGITFAAAGLIRFIGSSVQAAQEAEQSQLRLNQAFKTFPALANVNIDVLRKLNTQMSFKTKFDDDALASGEAVLGQFKLTGLQIKELIPLVADYAARTGQDIPSAATALGRAFLGNTRALKTIGINFKATGDTAKDYTTIVGLLRQKVGGFAEAEGRTFSGRLEILKTQFGELKESIGRAILPVLSTMANFFVAKLIPALSDFAGILVRTFGPTIRALIDSFRTAWNLLFPVVKDIAAVIGITLLGALKLLAAILKPLAPVIAAVGTALLVAFTATKIMAGVQAISVAIGALATKLFVVSTASGLAADANVALAGSAVAAVGAEQAFGASVLASLVPLQAQAAAVSGLSLAVGNLARAFAASLVALLPVAVIVASVVSTYKVLQRTQELVARANQATADSFLNDTIPALLRTGGVLRLTAEQWRLGPFGGADVGKTKAVFDALDAGTISTAEAFRRLKDIAGVTQDQIDQVVQAQLDSAIAADKQKGSYNDVATVAITAFKAAGTSAEQIGVSLRGLSQGALYQLQQQFTATGIPAEALSNIMISAQTPIKAVTFEMQGLTKAQIKYNQEVIAENAQVTKLQTRFETLGTAIDRFKKSLDATLGVQLTLEQATASYDQDLAALSESLKTNGGTFDLNTEKGRANSGALRTVVGDIEDMIAAQVRAGTVGASDTAQKDALLKRLQDLKDKNKGYPAVQRKIQDYIDTVKKTPVSRTTTITANTKPALDALSEFEQDLNNFGGRIAKESRFDINVSASADLSKITANNVDLTATNVYVAGRARAEGGPVAPAQPYVVGERGPELFVPKTAGTVVSNQQIRNIGGSISNFSKTVSSTISKTVSSIFRPEIQVAVPRQSGGTVTRNQLVLVGEKGPEVFVPQSVTKILSTDGRTENFFVTVNNPKPEPISESVPKILRRKQLLRAP